MYSPEGFKALRRRLRLEQDELADLLGLGSDRTLRRWEDNEKDIPGPVQLAMELIEKVPEVRRYLGLKLRDPDE